jgi:hypothetical protein
VRSFSESWVKKEISLKLQAAMQQDIIYLQRLKREAKNMKHKFTIIYETDGLPICPDAIHKQLDVAMDNIRKKFSEKYYKLPGLHRLSLAPCGDWFPEEQKPMKFKLTSKQP